MIKGERINSITHLAGAVFAAVGLVVLIVLAAEKGDPWRIVSFCVYGTTLVSLYLFSTLYHSLRGRAKHVFQMLDHAAIYLLIAGTYTPFTLVTLRGVWGWWLFGTVWGLALVGMVQERLVRKGRRIFSVVIYLVMGWIVVVALRPLTLALPHAGIVLLVAGGLSYTLGVVFFSLDKRIIYGHEIFHFFVLAGSICHFCCILFYVT